MTAADLNTLITDQIVAVSPLKVFLHCAVIQTDPGVVMTQTCKKQQYRINPLDISRTILNTH